MPLAGLTVCIAGINFWPDSTGIAPYSSFLARALKAAGADVDVVTGIPHYPEWSVKDAKYYEGTRWEETWNGIPVTRVRHHVPARANLSGRLGMEASFFARASKEIRASRSDILIAVTPSISALAASVFGKRKRPLGVIVQDLTGNAASESGTTSGNTGRLVAASEYALLRQADRVAVITPHFGKVLVSHGIEASAIAEMPNFTHIVPASADSAAARRALGWPTSKTLAVHTGNMGMKQGLETVVRAAQLSEESGSDTVFMLVGDGNRRNELEKLGAGVSTLFFVDPLSEKDYPLALAAADVLLINERPGVKEMSLPSKLTSYAGAGRPIVAAVEEGGITHSVLSASDSALLVPVDSASDLLSAVRSLAGSPDARHHFAEKALSMYRDRFSSASARERYVGFAQSLGGMR